MYLLIYIFRGKRKVKKRRKREKKRPDKKKSVPAFKFVCRLDIHILLYVMYVTANGEGGGKKPSIDCSQEAMEASFKLK